MLFLSQWIGSWLWTMYRWRRVSRFGTRALLRLPRIDRGLGHYGFMSVGPIHWAARGAEGVVIALDFSSTRWATFFALSLFGFLLRPAAALPAVVYRGLPCLRPWYIGRAFSYSFLSNSMPLITSKRARVLALHLILPGRWPAPALGMRHSRAGTAVAQRFDFVARRFDFCAGHGNLFFLPPTLRRRGSAQGVSAAGSLPPLLALDWPSCWPFGQAPACPFECARVVVFYNYFERSWFC